MHELVGAHRMRHAIGHLPLAAVDDDLAAAAQPQPRVLLPHVLLGRFRMSDLGGDVVDRRRRADLDQQLGGAVEPAQADSVGAERDAGRVYGPVPGLAAWPVVEITLRAYSRSSSQSAWKVRCDVS